MIRSDTRSREQRPMSANRESNMNTISMEVISEIEKELMDSPYDMISLVFLLYEVPDTALQRLLVYQRVSKDVYSTNMNLLHEWMQVAKTKPTWREEFLEALLICQLYGIVRKLGFNVEIMKRQYQPDNIHYNVNVNLTKKTLYKLCENIDAANLNMLKRTLNTYQIDTDEYDTCELVFLKLMSEKIITLNKFGFDKKSHGCEFNFDKFIKLIQKLPGMESLANELWMIENWSSEEYMGPPVAASSPSLNHTSDLSGTVQRPVVEQLYNGPYFNSLYDELSNLHIDESNIESDSKVIQKNRYQIKDPKNIGVCLIINQEVFHFCDQSIEDKNLTGSLSQRTGSTFDKIELEKTMSYMNFEVISKDNLNHTDMINFIKSSLKNHVTRSTSVFMLCILSHGVKDHVYAADSIKVKIVDIQNLLDSHDCLLGIPKILIIQACQDDDLPQTSLVADSPNSTPFRPRFTDYLIYTATSPQLQAFRSLEAGSIFIRFLCEVIKELGKKEHLQDISTTINSAVNAYCTKNKIQQTPRFTNSLTKKLYLFNPK